MWFLLLNGRCWPQSTYETHLPLPSYSSVPCSVKTFSKWPASTMRFFFNSFSTAFYYQLRLFVASAGLLFLAQMEEWGIVPFRLKAISRELKASWTSVMFSLIHLLGLFFHCTCSKHLPQAYMQGQIYFPNNPNYKAFETLLLSQDPGLHQEATLSIPTIRNA